MKKKIKLKNEEIRQHLIEVINGLPLDPVHVIEIKPYKRNRSMEQNAYYWKLLRIMGDDLGYSVDELHVEMKKRFLLPYLISKEPELENAAIENEEALARVISTTILKVNEFSEYLEQVIKLAMSLGIKIPYKED